MSNESSNTNQPNSFFASTVKRPATGETNGERLKLLVFETDGFTAYTLKPESGPVRIGRAPNCHVQLHDPTTSRHHATLDFNPLRLEDAGSANGVFVDERRLQPSKPVPLRPGQPFLIGQALLVVHQGSAGVDASILDRAKTSHPEGARALGREVVARAPNTLALFALVERIARGHINVLVLGETGTGKELVAEAIHRNSPRRDKPFIRLNCAALPEPLIESELFGHERGAFTGAVAAKAGVIESASGGTVLLDEVGELSPATQAKLLRVIEAQEVQRLGALRARRVDVRFVSATHRNLAADTVHGTFRADLYYRLNGVCVEVPPLRARGEDVLPLAQFFLAASARRLGASKVRLTRGAELALLKHNWPGNVRELRNAVERAALLAPTEDIEAIHLGLVGTEYPTLAPQPASPNPPGFQKTKPSATSPIPPNLPARATREDSERQRIVDALGACNGNQTRAAKLLGMPRRTFVSKLSLFDIPRPRKP